MSTPHNAASNGQIAKTVLMPGDPLRAKYIADHFLEDAVLFNEVRGMFGYTGTYKGKPVSVMGSGMGMPSIGIYSYELYQVYDVERIIRIGSAGSYVPDLKVMDLFLADSAFSESTFALAAFDMEGSVMLPDAGLNSLIRRTAQTLDIPLKSGRIHSSDVFYHEGSGSDYRIFPEKYGVDCVEMESFALFANAAKLGRAAACLVTISDSFVTESALSAKEREVSLHEMITLALETAVRE